MSSTEFTAKPGIKTILHGNHDDNDEQILLHAGRLSMIYENGNIRRIAIGKTEIIRMIYAAVRDKEWITIKPQISDEEFSIGHDSFTIRYRCSYISGNINFSTRFHIEGKSNNSLIFRLEGEALNTFEKNRIGFCILHPIKGYAGNECLIIHPGKKSEKCQFPVNISPNQPFKDISSIKWTIDDAECTLLFFGDTFETEDQRNWTDASYKTYCTPLRLLYPVKVSKGEKLKQRIEFKAELNAGGEQHDNEIITINICREKISDFPKIGIGQSTRPEPLTETEIKVLRDLKFDHYRIDIYLFMNDWKAKTETALSEAKQLEYPVELALFFDENYLNQTTEFLDWLTDKHANIKVISLFHKDYKYTPDLLTDSVSPILKNALPRIKIASGTNANFAQLNRNRPATDHNDLICYSIHPQEHASDNLTLTENLKAQEYSVVSTKTFYRKKDIWISPVNIQRRFNANTDNYERISDSRDLPAQIDSRQMSLFGACWTAGSLKYLFESGIEGVTFYETVGERGICQGDYPSRWPRDFMSHKGMIFPLFHVFQYLLKNKSYKVTGCISSHPLKADALIITSGTRIKIILINFTSVQQKVTIKECSGDLTKKELNSQTFADAVSDFTWEENGSHEEISSIDQLPIEPFSVAFIDGYPNL